MFKIGDYVFKASVGLCLISDITELNDSMSREKKSYYVLIPIDDDKDKIYVPLTASINLRKSMNPNDAMEIIQKIPDVAAVNIRNEKEREKTYKEAVKSSNPESWIRIIKTMYIRKKKRNEIGKKSTMMDERYFKLAEKYLYSELEFALKKSHNEINLMIEQSIQDKAN